MLEEHEIVNFVCLNETRVANKGEFLPVSHVFLLSLFSKFSIIYLFKLIEKDIVRFFFSCSFGLYDIFILNYTICNINLYFKLYIS